ncbi:hypothetical protein ACIQCF_38555 [Streptomyces sp. NPDC088353]|uniref:hypothetical protein n=1 Tax=Streptomyces sp. NPDC088353 TaxID=3365855 RepID=UPI0037F71D30
MATRVALGTQASRCSGEGHGPARRHRLDVGGNRNVNSILHIVHVAHSSRQESGSGLRGWPALFDLVDEALELGDLVLQGAVTGGSE